MKYSTEAVEVAVGNLLVLGKLEAVPPHRRHVARHARLHRRVAAACAARAALRLPLAARGVCMLPHKGGRGRPRGERGGVELRRRDAASAAELSLVLKVGAKSLLDINCFIFSASVKATSTR